uniref:BLTX107 n=1 Tax=Nephila pilipes TaxID=299642 RepID=A0A076L026_NEPPI|nr:BLTX107 [Nephila pilipes]AII97987.1 BLTX630 [Nephila pilipes]
MATRLTNWTQIKYAAFEGLELFCIVCFLGKGITQ